MKRWIYIAALAVTMIIGSVSAARSASPTAAQVLQNTSDKLAAGGYIADFTVKSQGDTYEGSIKMAGSRFRLTTPYMQVWYDGHTQWAYSPESAEVNVTEPTADELAQVNPLVIVTALQKGYDAVFAKTRVQGAYVLDLVPRKGTDSDIRRIILTVNASTLMPKAVAVTLTDGTTFSVNIKSIVKQANLALSSFVFNHKEYPKAQVIDLR